MGVDSVEDRTALMLIPASCVVVRPLPELGGMKWLVFVVLGISFVLVFAPGCHAVGDTLVCMSRDDEWKQEACEDQRRSSRYEEEHRAEWAAQRAQLEREAQMNAYLAVRGSCEAGDARACFNTALYEERYGAPYLKIEPHYRLACTGGVGRACFVVGAHARTRISDPRSAESAAARELALASFTHGCELGDSDSCHAGLELDPTRVDLVKTACAAEQGWACRILGR